MHNWEFLQNAHGRWFWRHTPAAGPQTVSGRDFASRTECMADAIRDVYSASRAPGRKMRDSDRQYPL